WDDSEPARSKAARQGVPVCDLAARGFSGAAALVLSPGIPLHHPAPHPVVAKARQAGVEVIGDIELLARAAPGARYVGVTGTNGKSTTTALIGHVLAAAGLKTETGGNLGTPALALAPLDSDGIYVLEVSSFQLDLSETVSFDAAVLLNLSADHLYRHGGMDGYIAAKRRIFRNQDSDQTAVVGVDDAYCVRLYEELEAADAQRVVPISGVRTVAGGVFVEDGILVDGTAGTSDRVMDLKTVARLPGVHNWQNCAAAFAACRAVGLAPWAISAGIQSFPGLPHRQELVATVDGVRFVNDSKATNADAVARALACYDTVYWIAGGRPKEGGIAALEAWFPRIVHAFLMGEAEDEFAATLEGRVPYTRCGHLASAVRLAAAKARDDGRPGAVVLLSPACASFDQWENFEARGEGFRRLVDALKDEAASGSPGGAGPGSPPAACCGGVR
ncbi:MAG: UDP-N-acetylmuramoyl-L-alanine--D-glutamate ligase, partial [Alphaproteobacteria bacterium]